MEIIWRTVGTVKKYHTELFIFNYALQPFKAYYAIWVRRFNFRHQASQRVSLRESTQRRKVELWARNVREFCLNSELHVTFNDLLRAVKLRHGYRRLYFPSEGRRAEDFFLYWTWRWPYIKAETCSRLIVKNTCTN
jgi:hypothetical protein